MYILIVFYKLNIIKIVILLTHRSTLGLIWAQAEQSTLRIIG